MTHASGPTAPDFSAIEDTLRNLVGNDLSRIGHTLWQHVDREDPHDSGWWQLARLTRWEDGRVTLETNTRGSVISTEITLSPEAVTALVSAVETLR